MKELLKEYVFRGISLFGNRQVPRIFCAAMVRNEVDIIEVWLKHVLLTFDRVIIYDHLSTDGTREFLLDMASRESRLEVRIYDEIGYEQSMLMTEALQAFKQEEKKGWAFFLDADEFIFRQDGEQIKKFLKRISLAPLVKMYWVNVYPSTAGETLSGSSILKGWRYNSIGRKSAINLDFVTSETIVDRGNHTVTFSQRWNKMYRAVQLGFLLHIPVRADRQLKSKLDHGNVANDAVDLDRTLATHWREMSADISDKGLNDLRSFCWRYGELDKPEIVSEDIEGALASFVAI